MKKLCFVNPGINIRRPISFIMNILKEKNYEITILTSRKKSEKVREATRHYDDFNGINLQTYPVMTRESGFVWPIPTNFFNFIKLCFKTLRENDIIHVWVPFYPNTFTICLLKLLFFKKKILCLSMDTFPAYSFKLTSKFDPLFRVFYKTIGKIPYIASNYVNIYAKSMIKFAIKAGVPKKKIRITPTGINFKLKKMNRDIREEFGIGNEEKIVLFVGLHNRRKGLDLILKTAKILDDEAIKFVCVGDGPMRHEALEFASKVGLKEKFVFAGTRLDVHNFYHQADLFFLPSRGEGLAGVLMEAMIYQVPIITSDIAGTRDLVTHMKNGLLCETENYNCYAKSIKQLLNNQDLREKFKGNGLKKIKKDFLWEKNIKNFEILYNLVDF